LVKPINLGIIGFSKGNGHPYSFASIINGFNKKEFKKSSWEVIYNYLIEKDESEFGFEDVKITHVWSPDKKESKILAKSTYIPNIVDNKEDMINKVDGVIIARDDYENHLELSRIFLENGLFVFIDKPLCLDLNELKYFKKFLLSAKLMSMSGVRYARELDKLRANLSSFGKIKLVKGTVTRNFDKYGIHMLDGIFGVKDFKVKTVKYEKGKIETLTLKTLDGSLIRIDALGKSPTSLQFEFWSEKSKYHAEVKDNFTMFRRMLYRFVKMVRTKESNPCITIKLVKILVASDLAKERNEEIYLDEIKI